MKAYSTYKESGVEWIGEIPSHWEMRKVSRSFNMIGSGTTPKSDQAEYYDDGSINWVNTGDLNDGLLETTSKKITQKAFDEHSVLKLYPPGTLIIAMYGATIGKISIMGFEGCTNQACCALADSPSINNKFAFYWFLANKPYVVSLGYGGGQPNISQDIIRSLRISSPPLLEQQVIADFLDCKTAQIDALIEKKHRQIDLLQEQRTVFINHAVTKGLNPHVPLKDSCVEWLGEIPSHWDVYRLRYVIVDGTQNGIYKGQDYYVDDGVPLISMSEAFTSSVIKETAKRRLLLTPSELASFGLQEGDLLFARRSIVFEGSGKCSLVGKLEEPHVFESSIIRVRPNSKLIDPTFALYYLNSHSGRGQILGITKQVTISGIDAQSLKDIVLPVPSKDEQMTILERLDNDSKYIDKSIANILRTIEKMHEYRATLISDAVTGKIDVRMVV